MQPGVYTYGVSHEASLGVFIVAYLFLTSVSEGLILLSVYGWWRNTPTWRSIVPLGAICGWVTAAIAPLNLLLDLAQPMHFLNLYTNFNAASPLSWGAYILVGYETAVAMFAWSVVRLYVEKQPLPAPLLKKICCLDVFSSGEANTKAVHKMAKWGGIFAVVFAAALIVYTGALVGIPFGRTLMANIPLPVLYAVSALAVGAALYLWLITRYKVAVNEELMVDIKRILTGCLIGEMVILALLFTNPFTPVPYGYTSIAKGFGAHRVLFSLEIVLGLLMPLLLLRVTKRPHFGIIAVAVLLGSLTTRFNLVAGLQYVTVTGREFIRFAPEPVEWLLVVLLITATGLVSVVLANYLCPKHISQTSQIFKVN